MKEIFFVCFTPYQLLVSMYYAYKIKDIKKTLIFKDFADYHIDSSFYEKYFDNIFIIPYYDKKNIFVKQFYKSFYCGYLFRFSPIFRYIKNIENSVIMYFSDQEVSSNKIVRILMNNPTNYIILSEEGLGLYVYRESTVSLKTRIGYVLCGLKTCNVIGGSKYYNAILAKYPTSIHARFSDTACIMQNDLFLDGDFINSINLPSIIFNNYKKKALILGEPIKEIGINNDEYVDSLTRILDVYKHDCDIVVKPHPREDISIYDLLNDCTLLSNVKWVPVELLVLKYNFNIVISVYSASVVNIAKVNKNLNVFLTYPLYGLQLDSNLINEFNKYSNINVVTNYEDLSYNDNNYNCISNKKNENFDLIFLEKLIGRK